MLWIKSLHIVFIASWFAMLFYVPRIFVNLAQIESPSSAEYQRLIGMAQRLYRFGTFLALPALGFGLALWVLYGIGSGQSWFYAKMVAVALTLGYHHACGLLLRKFQNAKNTRNQKWFRWFNEVPVLLLLVAVVLVVVKPQL
ncbi:MAG: CopD family protein [Cytophagales bacterium]|nr:CopD family protein [Cytophagales bacterium]